MQTIGCLKVPPSRSAPYLPVEITTAIVKFLECYELDYDFNRCVWPIHTKDCIRNVQKARLISRDFLYGSAQLFGKLLSDTVFTLTPKCLEFLDGLSQNVELSSSIRTLTFGSTYIPQLKPYRQYTLEKKWSTNADLDAANQEIFKAWHFLYDAQKADFKTGRTEEILIRIFRQFKNLKNIRFRPHVKMIRGRPYSGKFTWPTKELRLMLTKGTAELGHAVLERFRMAVYDDCYTIFPMIQRALSKSGVHLESLISTSQRELQRRKGLLAFYDPPTVPLSPIFGQMKLFYWAIPAAPKRLKNSTRRFTTMLSSTLNNAPHLKSLHIIYTEDPDGPKCPHLSLTLKRPPQLELLDLEGIDIDRDSLLALVSNKLRRLRLSYIPNISSRDWVKILQVIETSTPLRALTWFCARHERYRTHISGNRSCNFIPESYVKMMSSGGTVAFGEGWEPGVGYEIVYRKGEAVGPQDDLVEPGIVFFHFARCIVSGWHDLRLV